MISKVLSNHEDEEDEEGVALYTKKLIGCEELSLKNTHEQVESLWVRIRDGGNKRNLVVGVYYRPPDQGDPTDETFLLQLQELADSRPAGGLQPPLIQEELEAIVYEENDDIVAIAETWWDDTPNWGAAMDGYKLFRSDRQGRRGGGVALYVRECFDCLELNDGDERVKCLWVRIRGKVNKADIMVGVCYRPPNQD
ncbi:mitochondrial fission process protein 1 [Limosa lapponica baueri]|uniref:Mitochondrial fission process protein 1 n=1 Tax=Limosa lapponica baueri TaxID=1758121 RepID=A0A2I0TL83_LIMLA|nr:mitochondrial fission process protein 1 [Limosa lapponica baueri]